MRTEPLGVIGASSLVGIDLIGLAVQRGWMVQAFSRQDRQSDSCQGMQWHLLPLNGKGEVPQQVAHWICLAPIWTLPEHLPGLTALGVRRLVALSSTSRFAKADSAVPEERAVSARMAHAEASVMAWAEANGVEWTILRPTLIYGHGRDHNVSAIARMARRWGVVPVCGEGKGLRQPVHVADIAQACLVAVEAPCAGRALQLSGGETLSFREMVRRIFVAQSLKPRIWHVSRPVWRLCAWLTGLVGRPQLLGAGLRMNIDQVFAHDEAKALLAYRPRGFNPELGDLRK